MRLSTFKFWFYALKIAMAFPLVIGLSFVLYFGGFGGSFLIILSFLAALAAGAFGILLFFVIFLGFKLKCPFCDVPGRIGGDKETGLWLECGNCGLVHGSGRLGITLVRSGASFCATCGYDVSRNKGRCPECGCPIAEEDKSDTEH